MSLKLRFTAPVGLTLQATVERASDGYFWQRVEQTWAANPNFSARTISLTEGAAQNAGSYSLAIDNLSGSPDGDPGLVFIRIHSATDSTPNRVIEIVEGFVKDSEFCGVDANVSSRADGGNVSDALVEVLTSSLLVDELTGPPPSRPTIAQALALMFTALRNGVFSDARTVRFYNDAGTAIFEAPITATEGSTTRDRLRPITTG